MLSDHLNVFLSSTHADLADVRENIIKFISILKSDVLAMEVFGSDESQPIDFCLSKVKACNIFVGIYAERYGSIDSKSGKSITELEYLEANRMLKAGHLKGLLLYLIDPQAEWPLNFVERDPKKVNRLENFKQRIKKVLS